MSFFLVSFFCIHVEIIGSCKNVINSFFQEKITSPANEFILYVWRRRIKRGENVKEKIHFEKCIRPANELLLNT